MSKQIAASAKVNGQRPFAEARCWAMITMKWFPAWANVISAILLACGKNYVGAFMALCAVGFATLWIVDRKW